MKKRLDNLWKFNLLNIDIDNNQFSNPFSYYKFIKQNHHRLNGNLVKVFQGKFLSTILLLKKLKSKKIIYAFDSFSGFLPSKSPYDDTNFFKKLFEKRLIDQKHYEEYLDYLSYLNFKTGKNKFNQFIISSSQNFANTNLMDLKKKIDFSIIRPALGIISDLLEYTIKLFTFHYGDKEMKNNSFVLSKNFQFCNSKKIETAWHEFMAYQNKIYIKLH